MILFRYTYHALSVNSSYRICISMSCAMITFIWQPGYPDLLFRGCMPFNSLTFLFIRCITAWISASLALIFMIAIMLSLVFIITVVLWLINTWCKLENHSIYKFIDFFKKKQIHWQLTQFAANIVYSKHFQLHCNLTWLFGTLMV